MRVMNYLKAVFWEYPQFIYDEYLSQTLKRARSQRDLGLYRWIMRRFLEYARVVDTLRFFTIDEIAENLKELRLSAYSKKKWQRLLEVYRGT